MQTFLLEKSRVPTTIATGERNYHIFYHVLKGSNLLPDTDPASQRLLNRSSCTTVPNVDDVDEYKQVVIVVHPLIIVVYSLIIVVHALLTS